MTRLRRIRSKAALVAVLDAGGSLEDCLVLGLELPAELEQRARARGAVVFPPLPHRPYDPYRASLYTASELTAPSQAAPDTTVDQAIAAHFNEAGAHPPLLEALAQRLHDYGIDEALADAIGASEIDRLDLVGFMGGHSTGRDQPAYALTARTAFLVAKAGFRVVTGGGPGMMEAANLGAYMAHGYTLSDLETALNLLAKEPTAPEAWGWRDQAAERARYERYVEQARQVRQSFPAPAPAGPRRFRNLAVPTWFYGWEPSNLFADATAKYFSNSLREDGLLTISVGGVVYTPGSLGTTQEVFVDAAQNHYASTGYVSPMAFLGVDRYQVQTAHWTLLKQLAGDRPWGRLLFASDSPEDIAAFLVHNRPVPRE
jgi:predicted Rossmann-fold nucleotide-binding protein